MYETFGGETGVRRGRIALRPGRRATAALVVPPARDGGPSYRGQGDVDYVCGACDAVLCSGVRAGMFASLAFSCACGAVNTTP